MLKKPTPVAERRQETGTTWRVLQAAVPDNWPNTRVCARAGPGRLGTIAIDGTKIAANASWHAGCRRQWLQQQVDQSLGQAAAQDAAQDAACQGQTRWQLQGRRDREQRLRRALAEVIAEEAARGLAPSRGVRHTSKPALPNLNVSAPAPARRAYRPAE